MQGFLQYTVLYKSVTPYHISVNDPIPIREWPALNYAHSFALRQTKCIITSTSTVEVGFNIPIRRLTLIKTKNDFDWLDVSFDSYKDESKKLFP
jgi:hypothetical protein